MIHIVVKIISIQVFLSLLKLTVMQSDLKKYLQTQWNWYFFQWLFIRVCWRRVITSFRLDYMSMLQYGEGAGYRIDKSHKQYGLCIGVFPLQDEVKSPISMFLVVQNIFGLKRKKLKNNFGSVKVLCIFAL